jgi:hypothetical protein
MKSLLIRLLALACLLVLPAHALPAVQDVTVGNVTASSACIAWEFTEAARPALEVFTDAAATQNVTNSVRIEIQSLENARREVNSTQGTRDANRALQVSMALKKVAFIRLSGLKPGTQYFLRPQGLALATDAVLVSAAPVPVTTASGAAFVPESRQLVADLSALVPVAGRVDGALLIASHAQAAYPLIAVVGDGGASTAAYLDLTLLLDSSGQRNLLPPVGPLQLSLSWLGLPEINGVFQPDTVPFTGATTVAAASNTGFIGQGYIIHATPSLSTPLAGVPLTLDLSVTDLAGVVQTGFNSPLSLESASLASGAGLTAPLQAGRLSGHPLVFSTAGLQSVTVNDPGSSASTTFQVKVLPMTYYNWRSFYHGNDLATGATGADPDGDSYQNFVEFIHALDPKNPNGSVLGASRTDAKALVVHFDLNPYQREYQVVIQVSADLKNWHRSHRIPQIKQSFAEFNMMEASWTEAELLAETGVASPGYFARLTWEPATSLASWFAENSLTGTAADPSANPDDDGAPNFVEFALDSDPNSGISSGKVRQTTERSGGITSQVLTLPMRLGASPPGGDPSGGELVFEVDGIRYRIQGTHNLTTWTLDMEEIPALANGLPELNPGYEYRSFRNANSTSNPFEFLRVRVEYVP